MPWTKFGNILGPQGLQGEVSVDPNTVTGAASTPAIVEDLDARPTHAQLKFTIPQGIQGVQGVQGEVAVDSTVTGAAGSQALVEDLDPSPNKALLKFTIPRGNTGATGNTGPQGEVSVVGTNTISPGSQASVVDQDGRPTHAALLFNIPAGIQGVQGIQGEVAVATTETLPPGTPAFVNDSEASPNRAVLHFGIPQGLKGDKGDIGPQGPGGVPSGPAGGDLAGTYPDPTLAVDRVRKTGDTMTGGLTVQRTDQSSPISMNAIGSNGYGSLIYSRDGVARWFVRQGTSGTLDDFLIQSRDDAGALRHLVLHIKRATGLITVLGDPTEALGIATKQYIDNHPWAFAPGVKQLTAGTDLNILQATGFYDVNGPLNPPVAGDWFYIEVYGHSNDQGTYTLQRATPLTTAGPIPPVTYMRARRAGAWGPWEKQAGASEFVAKAGDTMTGTAPASTVLTVKGAAGQSAPILKVQDSGGVDSVAITASGFTSNVAGTFVGWLTAGSLIVNNDIDVTNGKVKNVATPTDATDGANKGYVDARVMYGTGAPPAQVAPAGTIYCQYT